MRASVSAILLLCVTLAHAEENFRDAQALINPQDMWQVRNAMDRLSVRSGKTAARYREKDASPPARRFEELAQLCLSEKKPDELTALLAAHREGNADELFDWVWDNWDWSPPQPPGR